MAKIQVIFYSMYGHMWKMAEAVAEGRSAGSPPRRSTFIRLLRRSPPRFSKR